MDFTVNEQEGLDPSGIGTPHRGMRADGVKPHQNAVVASSQVVPVTHRHTSARASVDRRGNGIDPFAEATARDLESARAACAALAGVLR